MVLLWCMGPVSSADPCFGFITIGGAIALLLLTIAGGYLLLRYLVRWAGKA